MRDGFPYQGNSGPCNTKTKTKTKCFKDPTYMQYFWKILGARISIWSLHVSNHKIQKYTDKDKAKVLFCSAISLKQLLFLSQTIYLGEVDPLYFCHHAPWIHLELLSCRRRKVSAKELLRCLCFVMNVWKGGGLSPRRTLTYHHQSYSPPQHPQTHKISRKFRSRQIC